MIRYVVRALKYAVKLAVLLAVVFFLVNRNFSLWDMLLHTTRGLIFLCAVVVWVAVYPWVEYVSRWIGGTFADKGAIVRALHAGGMTLVKEDEDRMVFHGYLLRRLWWLGEETVVITRGEGGGLTIEGPRKFTMEAQQRIPAYIENEKN